jgi:hypothetical protein
LRTIPGSLRHDEGGKGTIRTLVSLALIALVVYAGMTFIPVRAAAFQLDDEVREQVVLAGSGRRRVGDEEIRRTILTRAQSLGLAVDTRALVIRRTASEIYIDLEYDVPVELPGYTYVWHFESHHSGPVF